MQSKSLKGILKKFDSSPDRPLYGLSDSSKSYIAKETKATKENRAWPNIMEQWAKTKRSLLIKEKIKK